MAFASERRDVVPGRDAPWEAGLLWAYLQLLARTCKPSTIVSRLSMLAYHGSRCGHILPVSKNEQPSLLYKDIVRMRKQLKLDAAEKISPDKRPPVSKVGLANTSIVAILSAHGVSDAESFQRLSDIDRQYVATAVMQHTAGLSFGHFVHRHYKPKDFSRHSDGSWSLRTTWGRYAGVQYLTIRFPSQPTWDCMRYDVGEVSITAADIITWYFETLPSDARIFVPRGHDVEGRLDYQAWIRKTLRTAWPQCSHTVATGIKAATPHSFRAGFAADLQKEGATLRQLKLLGRWKSERAVVTYTTRVALAALGPTGPCFSPAELSPAVRPGTPPSPSRWADVGFRL